MSRGCKLTILAFLGGSVRLAVTVFRAWVAAQTLPPSLHFEPDTWVVDAETPNSRTRLFDVLEIHESRHMNCESRSGDSNSFG